MDIDTTMSPKEWINAQLREGDEPLELRRLRRLVVVRDAADEASERLGAVDAAPRG